MPLTPEFQAQYESLQRGAGYCPLPARTVLHVSGSDRMQFLHSFLTNDIKKLRPTGGCEAFVTSPQGKTIGHVFVFCEDNQFALDTTANEAAPLMAHFSKYVITEDVEFS